MLFGKQEAAQFEVLANNKSDAWAKAMEVACDFYNEGRSVEIRWVCAEGELTDMSGRVTVWRVSFVAWENDD